MIPLPPRDTHAEALAAKIIDLTLSAQVDIRDFHAHHDYRGAADRQDMWKYDVFEACKEFNKHEAAHRQRLERELMDLCAAIPKPRIIFPAPENE